MNEHWVIIAEWCVDFQGGLSVVGVYHSEKEALKAFRNRVDEVDRVDAEGHGYDVMEDNSFCFDSGCMGYYAQDHIKVTVEHVDGKSNVPSNDRPQLLMPPAPEGTLEDQVASLHAYLLRMAQQINLLLLGR